MSEPRYDAWALLGMGTTTAACFLIPMALGWLVDELLGTLPIFVFVGLVVGIAAAARYAYHELQKYTGS